MPKVPKSQISTSFIIHSPETKNKNKYEEMQYF